MKGFTRHFDTTGYAPVNEDDKQQLEQLGKSHRKLKAVVLLLLTLSVLPLSGYGVFRLGANYEKSRHIKDDWLAPAGYIDHTFHYRRAFAERPGNDSAAAWKLVFPRGRGFVQHPEVSPEPRGVAVFHQLHCLNAIRVGYWAATDGLEPPHHAEPGHIRHCIDYLRQAIMCGADTNLEPIDEKLGGVTGFGYNRKCRDIVQIIHWADKWRTHNQTGTN